MNAFEAPEHLPRRRTTRLKWLGKTVLKCMGWELSGELPSHHRKFIMPVAPHTSNWDFIVAIAAMFALDIKVTFLGKESIFKGAFGRWLTSLGGIGIDRSHRHGVVGQMVERFAEQEDMILALAPEGTRSKTKEWKTGFIFIAKEANVPIVPVGLDYKAKQVVFLPAYSVSADIATELQTIKAMYKPFCAKNPHLV